jgi:exopolyphosphatase/guanosine-5'-triphosphate,3'-diphosphate pyrophosphatase
VTAAAGQASRPEPRPGPRPDPRPDPRPAPRPEPRPEPGSPESGQLSAAGPAPADVAAVELQLGRPPRGLRSVAHRCPCGLPDVVETAPRLPDGTPFPTLYYLTCPRACAAVSRLEASGLMAEMRSRLAADAGLRRACLAAHRDYLARREAAARAAGVEPLPPGTGSAGGMPDRVKCLHALAAHELAVPGTNVLGREAILAAGSWWQAGPCVPGARNGPAKRAGEMAGGQGDRPARGTAGGRGDDGAAQQHLRRVAAIDCGTNSLRLLIADADDRDHVLIDIERRMEIVRLGQGVDATGRLAPEALARTFRVLADYGRAIRASGASEVRMAATSATRDAANAEEFTRGVTQILGIAPEVISGQEEAFLSFTGATAELAGPGLAQPDEAQAARPQPPYLVVDIGGGSTEFVLGGAAGSGEPAGAAGSLAALSTNIGCVRLTERHLRSDPPSQAEIDAATADIDVALASVAASVPVSTAATLVGLAGSVTTVTGIALGLQSYDAARIHHARVAAARVHEVTTSLLSQARAQRAAIGVLHPGRVDVIAAGALILDRIMICFGFAEMVASEHDILDGIAWSIVSGGR